MAEIRFEIGDPKSKRTYGKTIENYFLTGKKVGEVIDGQLIGLPNYQLRISGGSDTAGFPMRPDIEGIGRKRLVLSRGSTGFKGKKRKVQHKQNHYFLTKRKSIRGNTISQFTKQINLQVVKAGEKSIPELLGIQIKEEPKAELPKPEVKKEAPKAEALKKSEAK
ncbi:30S ribosomal protein S6e [Candidatus Woesearchaeota archaeon]|nr:30S ribosomal protein S6e [Candidatus Woesearchaeota archaeon]